MVSLRSDGLFKALERAEGEPLFYFWNGDS